MTLLIVGFVLGALVTWPLAVRRTEWGIARHGAVRTIRNRADWRK